MNPARLRGSPSGPLSHRHEMNFWGSSTRTRTAAHSTGRGPWRGPRDRSSFGIAAGEAADFQHLAAPILYADPRFRVASEAIQRGAGAQSGLWPYAISGDLPIVVLRIYDIEDMPQVAQLLRAHEYWRMKRLAVDLVIVNEHAASYMQDLQIAIETAVRSSNFRSANSGGGDGRSRVFQRSRWL